MNSPFDYIIRYKTKWHKKVLKKATHHKHYKKPLKLHNTFICIIINFVCKQFLIFVFSINTVVNVLNCINSSIIELFFSLSFVI